MRFGHLTVIALIAALHWVIPVILILWTWNRSYSSVLACLTQALVLVSYMTFVYFMGSWVFASFYLRYALPILAAATIIRSFVQVRNLSFFVAPPFSGWLGYGAGIIISAALLYFVIGAFRSYFYSEPPVQLAFPFKNGVYAVFEGGNGRRSFLMNYHYGAAQHKGANTNLSMRYAVDITKVTPWGNDANGFLPIQNERYAVFDQIVSSPCEGEVLDVEDQWPNETPWHGNPPYNVGNHILIGTKEFGVLMGHLQKGSILVKVGEKVSKGQPIAQAGNSGWTSQPHLHVQAMKVSAGLFWGWEGLPIYFDGKNPVKNTLFFKN